MALSERFRGRSVAEVLAHRAAESPPAPLRGPGGAAALLRPGGRARPTALAAALYELGIEAGDRIALNLPNWPEFVVAHVRRGQARGDHRAAEPAATPRRSCSTCSGTPSRWWWSRRRSGTGVDYLARFEGFLASLPDLQYVVSVGEEDLWYDDRVYQFEDLVSSGEGREFPAPEVDPDEDLFAIVYTSGTMGKPKGVSLTHTNLLSTRHRHRGGDRTARPRTWSSGVTTLFNVFGLAPGVLGTVAAGATLVLQEGYDPAAALDLLERERVTVLPRGADQLHPGPARARR